jgi:hypothetical protein
MLCIYYKSNIRILKKYQEMSLHSLPGHTNALRYSMVQSTKNMYLV